MSLPEPYYDDGNGIVIYNADCRQILPHLPPVDLVLTDPPYAIPQGSCFWRQNGTELADYGDKGFNASVDGWRCLAAGLCRSGSYWAEWCRGAKTAAEIYADLTQRDFTPWREFFLVKTAPAPTPRPTFMSAVEVCAIAYRGTRQWYGGQHPDRWIGLTPNRLGIGEHPTQKPLGAIAALMKALSANGHIVLDPFMGSGTTLRAAKDLGLSAIGIEIEEKYCAIAVDRLRQEVLPFAGAK